MALWFFFFQGAPSPPPVVLVATIRNPHRAVLVTPT